MTKEEIKQIVLKGETLTVEFKTCRNELGDAVFETVCAFLNRSGGYVFLGITDDGEITGVNESSLDSMFKNFASIVNNPQQLNPTSFFSPEVIDMRIMGSGTIYIK